MNQPTDPCHARLSTRRSRGPRGLVRPAPPLHVLQAAVELAATAPDHQGLHPFRFVWVDDDARPQLAELFSQAAIDQGRDAAGVAAARERALAGPGLLAVVARIRDDVPDVPPHEQWIGVGAALMNLLNALHLAGFAAKTLGGSLAREARVQRAFCVEGETIACWVMCGSPRPAPADGTPQMAARREVRRDLIEVWTPPERPA